MGTSTGMIGTTWTGDTGNTTNWQDGHIWHATAAPLIDAGTNTEPSADTGPGTDSSLNKDAPEFIPSILVPSFPPGFWAHGATATDGYDAYYEGDQQHTTDVDDIKDQGNPLGVNDIDIAAGTALPKGATFSPGVAYPTTDCLNTTAEEASRAAMARRSYDQVTFTSAVTDRDAQRLLDAVEATDPEVDSYDGYEGHDGYDGDQRENPDRAARGVLLRLADHIPAEDPECREIVKTDVVEAPIEAGNPPDTLGHYDNFDAVDTEVVEKEKETEVVEGDGVVEDAATEEGAYAGTNADAYARANAKKAEEEATKQVTKEEMVELDEQWEAAEDVPRDLEEALDDLAEEEEMMTRTMMAMHDGDQHRQHEQHHPTNHNDHHKHDHHHRDQHHINSNKHHRTTSKHDTNQSEDHPDAPSDAQSYPRPQALPRAPPCPLAPRPVPRPAPRPSRRPARSPPRRPVHLPAPRPSPTPPR